MKKKRSSRSSSAHSTRRVTTCAILSALATVSMTIGSYIEVLDLSMAVVASFACIIAVIEYGKGVPWTIYAVTSILSLLILPNKTPAFFFAAFFGFYPILKASFEARRRVLSWILKLLTFNVSLSLIATVIYFIFAEQKLGIPITPIVVIAAVLVAQVVFVIYDIALTRIISYYILKLRHRLKF